MSLSDEFYGIPESQPDLYASRKMKEIALRWDSKAALWDTHLADEKCHLNDNNAYAQFIAVARQLVMSRQEICMKGSLVDLGCGTGALISEFHRDFRVSLGVDISQEMLLVASAKNIENANWSVDDIFNGAWCKQLHSAVLSRGILLSHYGSDLAKLLITQTSKSLVSGGFALFDYLSSQAPMSTRTLAPNKSYYTSDWLIEHARSSGLSGVVVGDQFTRVRYLILMNDEAAQGV
jgi:predicted TPR repeat methyltransferase